MFINFIGIFKDILIDLVSMYFFAYIILYRRYGNKELFVTCALFNISLMMVVMSIVRTDFNLAVGFGLFALLSLITVRSAPFSMTEMAHFFGCIALAVINGSGITDDVFIVLCNAIIVICAFVLSTWATKLPANIGIGKQVGSLSIVLEYIDSDATTNPSAMRNKLAHTYKLDVLSYRVLQIDHIRDSMKIELVFIVSDTNNLLTTRIRDTNQANFNVR